MLESIKILMTEYRYAILLTSLAILCLVQLRAFWMKKNFTSIKIVLNVCLLATIALYIFQPSWKKEINTEKVLIVADTIDNFEIQKMQDSLGITETFDAETFKKTMLENSSFIEKLGKIYLFGQNIDSSSLHLLANHPISWIPFFKKNELQDISWDAVNYQGAIQRVSGKINLDKPQLIYLRIGNKTLDSLSLPSGFSNFSLNAPIASVGKVNYHVEMGGKILYEINFFALQPKPISILFLQSNPDFENKTLADFWAKKGNFIKSIVRVAKDNNSIFLTNQAESEEAQVIICDATEINQEIVAKGIQKGKNILFTNIAQPQEFIDQLNKQFNTKFQVKTIVKDLDKEEIAGFHATIQDAPFQESLDEYPIAVQRNSSKIGINLVNQTYPLLLSGDSLRYSKIWMQTLELLRPAQQEVVSITAPLFVDKLSIIHWKSKSLQKELKIDSDKVQSDASSIDNEEFAYSYFFRNPGWHSLQDSIAIYVADNQSSIAKAKKIESYISGQASSQNDTTQEIEQKIPETIWLGLFLLFLILIWLEPKLNVYYFSE